MLFAVFIIYKLLLNIHFGLLFLGLFGTVMIFFFGLPPKVNFGGHVYLSAREDEEEKRKEREYKFLSYIGLSLLGLSYLL